MDKRIINKVMNLETLTKAEIMDYINYSITENNEGGKMRNIRSISTSCLECESCNVRAKNPDLVCHKCYARRDLNRKKTLREKMRYNNKFYNNYSIPVDCIPFINDRVFRFESFGEIQTKTQIQNYYKIARKNSQVHFVLWTKNSMLIDSWKVRKPRNLTIIASSPAINTEYPETIYHRYNFVKKVFSVYTEEYAAEHGININCSGKCIDCMRCYDPNNNEIYINEILK